MSDDNEINITIDDRPVTVPKGTLVVEAANTIGLEIPVFCYHKKLGPFGCCRMCLVEVEKMPKLTTACTQTVMPDMVVKTNTDKVKKAREGVLEFTLLNHPLDCPVCDKGGECPLQNNTFKYGPGDTRMEFARAHNAKATPLSPVITIDRERCIACQRCTRYSDIIEQESALVMLNRGFNNEVGTFNNEPYVTKYSGNVIDICPVGALTNTQFRFKARTWDLNNSETLCSHCGCNCNMVLASRTNKFMRIETRPNDLVDDGWICDKARFGYGFIESDNRIIEATCVTGGERKVVDSLDAAVRAAQALKKVADENGSKSIGFLGSPYGTNEELYLYQKLFRLGLGTNNLDHKAYADTPGLPVDHHDFLNIETSNLVLLIASDPAEELPILDLRIKKAVTRRGVKLVVLNDQVTPLDRFAALSLRYNVGSDQVALGALTSGLAAELGMPSAPSKKNYESITGIAAGQMKSVVDLVRAGTKVSIVYNPAALSGDSVHVLKHLLAVIGKIPAIECGAIPAAPFTNALGAMDMGILPDFYPGGVSLADTEKIRQVWGENAPLVKGLSALEMIDKAAQGELKALLVYRCNPVVDFPGGKKIEDALRKLDLLVVHDMMSTETSRLANIILPSNGPGYDGGTTTNVGGRVQYRKRGLNTKNPPDWKIVSKMISVLNEEPAEYSTSFGVTDELAGKVTGYGDISKKSIKKEGKNREQVAYTNGLVAQAEKPSAGKKGTLKLRISTCLFANDKILEEPCILAHQFKPPVVHLHETDAANLGLAEGNEAVLAANGTEVRAIVEVSNRCNPGAMVVPRVSDEQGVLGLAGSGPVNWVEVRKG